MKRWKIMDNVFLVGMLLIAFFAWMDSQQIISFFVINTEQAWELYNQYTGPAIWKTWYVVFLAIGVIWYLIYKDKSEALALTTSGWALMWFGTQDMLYFLFSGQPMALEMCWVNMPPMILISKLMGETCTSPTAFIVSALVGVFVAYKSYNYLQKAKW